MTFNWLKQNQLVKVNCTQIKVANEMSPGELKCDKRSTMSSIFFRKFTMSHYDSTAELSTDISLAGQPLHAKRNGLAPRLVSVMIRVEVESSVVES